MNIKSLGFRNDNDLWKYLFNGGYFKVGVNNKEVELYKDDYNKIVIVTTIKTFDNYNNLIDIFRKIIYFTDYLPIEIADIMENYEVIEFI